MIEVNANNAIERGNVEAVRALIDEAAAAAHALEGNTDPRGALATLSRIIGVAPPGISQYRSGRRHPSYALQVLLRVIINNEKELKNKRKKR